MSEVSEFSVSVILCTYNPDWRKLKATLLSAAMQEDIDFEIVLTDDGSGEDDVSISYACSIEYGHAVHQRIVVTYDHALVYVAEGTYLAIFAYHSLWMYIGQGTDLAHNSIIYIMCMK